MKDSADPVAPSRGTSPVSRWFVRVVVGLVPALTLVASLSGLSLAFVGHHAGKSASDPDCAMMLAGLSNQLALSYVARWTSLAVAILLFFLAASENRTPWRAALGASAVLMFGMFTVVGELNASFRDVEHRIVEEMSSADATCRRASQLWYMRRGSAMHKISGGRS